MSQTKNSVKFNISPETVISPDMPKIEKAPDNMVKSPDIPDIKDNNEEKTPQIFNDSLKDLLKVLNTLDKRKHKKTDSDSDYDSEEDSENSSDDSDDSDNSSNDSEDSNDTDIQYQPSLEYKWNTFMQLLESHNTLCVAFSYLIKK